MFYFLETDIRKQKKYEMRTQTSVDNIVNDLRYEIKFENCLKDKNNFFIKQNIFYSHFFFFFCWADTKKDRCASVKASNAALAKLTD